ncbi:MAG TPA: heavy metal sensor histidine kinase [Candidatus Acidoferrales bacterium]|nr:heavy metal sensor histidine kinase [Candidatus Acidoferrales bacterium]
MSKQGIPRPKGWTLATRLTIWYAISAFLLVILATGFLYWALVSNLNREDDQFLSDEVHVLRVLLADWPTSSAAVNREINSEWVTRQYAQVFARILDSRGQALIASRGMSTKFPPQRFPSATNSSTGLPRGMDMRSSTGERFRALATRVSVDSPSHREYTIQIALNRSREEDALSKYRWDLGIVLSVMLFLCVGFGYEIARRGISPVKKISHIAARIGSATLHERIPQAGLPAELASLAATFNAMLDRLEESFARLSRFSADIAHELRTPVTNLRGEIEVMLAKPRSSQEYRQLFDSSLEEVNRLSRIVDSLLFLARAESLQVQLRTETTDAGREIRSLHDFYEAACGQAEVTLTCHAPEGLTAEIDRTLFQRAVGNVIENAMAHTPKGGSVSVVAAANNGRLTVQVSDTGCGIPEADLARVFEPFYRVDSCRSTPSRGLGLGLSIVRSIMKLHGGTVEISSAVGQGTTALLTFPTHPLLRKPQITNS